MGLTNFLVRRVQSSVESFGGQCTHSFSQAIEPVSAMIGKSKATKNGICQALCEMWIVFHAHDGALWNWLYSGEQINSSALANIAYNFKYGSVNANGHVTAIDDQDQNSDLFFMQYGIRRRSNIKGTFTNFFDKGKFNKVATADRSLVSGSRTGGTSRSGIGIKLGEDLVGGSMVKNMGLGDGTYRMIGVYGVLGAHCMCAFVGTDVVFFDPNFGEFYFAKREDFVKWFAEFWNKSFYDWGLSQSYTIRDYARAVGSGISLAGKF